MPPSKIIPTPYYHIDLSAAAQNFHSFLYAITYFKRTDIIAYSIKANYDSKLIKLFAELGSRFEVCSLYEFNYLRSLGIDTRKIIINGYIQNLDVIYYYIRHRSLVIISSFKDLQLLHNTNQLVNIGLRINIDEIKKDDSLYHIKFSRFGIVIDDKIKLFLRQHPNIIVTCLHAHLSGNTRNPLIYLDTLARLIDVQRELGLGSVEYIDIGGGYKTGKGYWSFNDYLEPIYQFLGQTKFSRIKLIFEPGNALTRNIGCYCTKIIDKVTRNNQIYLISDGSVLHLPFLRSCSADDYFIFYHKVNQIVKSQYISGITCKESDLLLKLQDFPELQVGDLVIFNNVGSYSLNEIPDFLIPKPYLHYSGCIP